MQLSAGAWLILLALAATGVVAQGAGTRGPSASTVNPIRKVVTLLQNMMKKVEAEGEKEQELYDKYMCYCKNADATLGKSIADADVKIPQLQTDIEEAEAKKAQLEEDVKNHQADRAAAKEAMAKATSIREKEAAAFAATEGELKSNVEAMAKAIAALE